jgi:hypothetical protein
LDFGRWGYYLIDDVLEKLNAAVACLKRIAINHFPHLAVFHEKPNTENDFRLNVAGSVSVPKEQSRPIQSKAGATACRSTVRSFRGYLVLSQLPEYKPFVFIDV